MELKKKLPKDFFLKCYEADIDKNIANMSQGPPIQDLGKSE